MNFPLFKGWKCLFLWYQSYCTKWVSVSLTGTVFDGWIKDLELIPVYTKNRLMSYSNDKELSGDAIGLKLSKKKKVIIPN